MSHKILANPNCGNVLIFLYQAEVTLQMKLIKGLWGGDFPDGCNRIADVFISRQMRAVTFV